MLCQRTEQKTFLSLFPEAVTGACIGEEYKTSARSLPSCLKYHLTSLMELIHGPPHFALPSTIFTSLSLYLSTGDTGSPWGQRVASVSPRSDRSRGSQVKLDGPLLILPLKAVNSSILCDPRPPAALSHLCPLPSTGCSLPSADHCLPVNCSV